MAGVPVRAYTLHEHQEQAVEHLARNPRAGLFLPVGAGKTLSVLHSLTPDHLPALVVAPKQVAEHVWAQEVMKWRPELSVALAIGNPVKRAAAIMAGADITVISRDNIGTLLNSRGKPTHHYRTIVLDESQSFKTKSSVRWKTARKLTQNAEHVWALTGTPAGNGLMDLWAQVYLIDNGKRLHPTLTAFRQRYFYPEKVLPNGVVAKYGLKPGAEQAIYKAIADVCLHIPLIGLDLPDKVVNTVPVSLPPASRKLYEQLKDDMVADLDLLGGADKMTVPSAGVLSSKLSQVTAGAIFGETTYDADTDTVSQGELVDLHTVKLEELGELVEQTEGGVLVFYRFKFEARRILDTYLQSTMITARGAVDAWNRQEIPLLVAHPASAGAGLNLQSGGSTIVWTSLSWSAEEWIQANGRLHRQGQQASRVMVHVLTVPDTVDEKILAALEGKCSVQQALLDALT